jgi:hypothetical protein
MTNPPTLAYASNPAEFELETENCERERAPPTEAWKDYLVEMTAQNIKRLTHTGEKLKKIETWIRDRFPAPDEMRSLTQKVSTSVIVLIAGGVTEFGSGVTLEMVVGSEAN